MRVLLLLVALVAAGLRRSSASVQVELSADLAAKLDRIKEAAGLAEASYSTVIEWLAEHADAASATNASAARTVTQSSAALHSAQAQAVAQAASAAAVAARGDCPPTQCLFDDSLFGMNPVMKESLRRELSSGVVADAVHYIKTHPNAGWMRCAPEGQTCVCTGDVRYGAVHHAMWSNPVHVDKEVHCTASAVGATFAAHADMECQCAWDSEKQYQPSIQLHYNSWSYLQEAFMMMMRVMAQARMLPLSGDRFFGGSELFGIRGGGVLDRWWIDIFLAESKTTYGLDQSRPLNCMEWSPVVYEGRFPGCEHTGYELSYEPDTSKMRVEGRTIYADVLDLPRVAGDLKMDLVIATQVWEHLNEPFQAAKAVFDAMHPGGIVLFAVPFVAQYHGAPYDFYRYTKGGVFHVLTRAGFCVPKSAMTGGGDYIYAMSLNAGYGAGDFSPEELNNAYHRGYDNIPDGAMQVFAVATKPVKVGDPCPE